MHESDGESDSESSFGSWSAGDFGSDGAQHAWNSMLLQAQGALLLFAAEPFCRPKVTYAIGPERWSFARIERDFGGSATCKSLFRFSLKDMRRLLRALRFPRVLKAGPAGHQYSATGEEALCILLRRMAYPPQQNACARVGDGPRPCGDLNSVLMINFNVTSGHPHTYSYFTHSHMRLDARTENRDRVRGVSETV